MITDLTRQRCFNHARREAVARCPECGRFFCRECITEHEDRVLCASCLAEVTRRGPGGRKGRMMGAVRIGAGVASFLVLWFVFFLFGRLLLNLPSSFHEGTVWQTNVWDELDDE